MSFLKCSCIRQHLGLTVWNAKHTQTQAHIPSSPPPPLSNLGHILCGRLGHTIPLGFEGIWWTSGLGLNLNIWITEKCVNTSLCFTFWIFSLPMLWVIFFLPSTVYSIPCSPLMVCSPRAHIWHPHQLYLLLSHSFKMYIHAELNITFMPLLSVLLSPSFSLPVTLPQCFHVPPLSRSVAIGIGFYGNSEANDGMYQLTSSLLTANYTLASIDLLVSGALCK